MDAHRSRAKALHRYAKRFGHEAKGLGGGLGSAFDTLHRARAEFRAFRELLLRPGTLLPLEFNPRRTIHESFVIHNANILSRNAQAHHVTHPTTPPQVPDSWTTAYVPKAQEGSSGLAPGIMVSD
jgi:hypothetical protein